MILSSYETLLHRRESQSAASCDLSELLMYYPLLSFRL